MKNLITFFSVLLKCLFIIFAINAIVFVLLVAVIVEWFNNKRSVSFPCDKDPIKSCPYKKSIKITGAGVISCSSDTIFKCCKGKKQLQYLKLIHEHHIRKNK